MNTWRGGKLPITFYPDDESHTTETNLEVLLFLTGSDLNPDIKAKRVESVSYVPSLAIKYCDSQNNSSLFEFGNECVLC